MCDASGAGCGCGVGPVASNTFYGVVVLCHVMPAELLHQEVVDGEKSIVLWQHHQAM